MNRGLVLLLSASAVIAALIAVAPLLLGGDEGGICRNPDHPQVSFTRAAASGGYVVGFTEFSDDASHVVHFVGGSGLEEVAEPRIQIQGGGTRDLRATDQLGCYVVDGSVPVNGAVRVTASAGAEQIRATVLRDRSATPPAPLIARVRRATAALAGLVERQMVRRRSDGLGESVGVTYGNGGYRVRSDAGDFEQTVADWQDLFYWTSPTTFTSLTTVGTEVIEGRELVRLSGFVPVPLWLEILVDPATGDVHVQEMLAAQHFMSSTFSGFRR